MAGLESERFAHILRRTRTAYAGIRLAPDEPPSFGMIALGDFGPAGLQLQLSFDRRWQRRSLDEAAGTATEPCSATGEPASRRGATWEPAETYWEGPAPDLSGAAGGPPAERRQAPAETTARATPVESGGLQLASPRHGVMLLSNGGIAVLLRRLQRPPGALLPAEVAGDVRDSDLFLFLPTLTFGTTGGEGLRMPVRSLWLSASTVPEGYLISAVFTLEEVSNPRAVERLFRLLIPLMLRRAGVTDPVDTFKALELVVEPTRVRIRDLKLSAGDLLRFLFLFAGMEDLPDGGSR